MLIKVMQICTIGGKRHAIVALPVTDRITVGTELDLALTARPITATTAQASTTGQAMTAQASTSGQAIGSVQASNGSSRESPDCDGPGCRHVADVDCVG
jgi:hypothetical protein